MAIEYCDGRRLRRLFLAGTENLLAFRAELDRINVFPLPDGDTGTNLAQTFRAMANAASRSQEACVADVANRLAQAGVLGARGNSGMMLSHFFLGFAEGLGDCRRASARDFAAAFRCAVDSLYGAVEKPVEGTVLTVVREFTEEAERLCGHVPDLKELARRLLRAAWASLERTPNLLPVLHEAKVVDAGAKGFVCFLEGVVGLIEGRSVAEAPPATARAMPDVAAAVDFPDDDDTAFRYCMEFVVRGSPLPERRELAEAVRAWSGSLIITRASSLAKIHLHTDDPERVRQALSAVGSVLECVKAEDMRVQHARRRESAAPRVAIVTDATCDLPPEKIIEYDITVVPLTVMFDGESYLDQIDITHEEFLRRLVDSDQPSPTTSQPSPAQLERCFRRAAEASDEVLGLFVSGALSGTLGQARAAAQRMAGLEIQVFDSRAASLGLGFQVLYAAELARDGWRSGAIIAELERVRERSGILLTLDTLEYMRRSGRLGRARAFVGQLLDLKPVLTLDSDGAVASVERLRGREALETRILELLRARIAPRRRRLRLGVVHVMCHDLAERLMRELEREFAPEQALIRPATGVLAAHAGPGAWAVVYQVE